MLNKKENQMTKFFLDLLGAAVIATILFFPFGLYFAFFM
jgi:hypothetical protein